MFNYHASFEHDRDKWIQFDHFLARLAEKYPKEFAKDIYTNDSFLKFRFERKTFDISYNFHLNVPLYIKCQILAKLKEIFPSNFAV